MVAHLFNFIENSLIFTTKDIEIAGIILTNLLVDFECNPMIFIWIWKYSVVQFYENTLILFNELYEIPNNWMLPFHISVDSITIRFYGVEGNMTFPLDELGAIIFSSLQWLFAPTHARATVRWNKVDNMISILTELRRIYIAIETNRPNKGK